MHHITIFNFFSVYHLFTLNNCYVQYLTINYKIPIQAKHIK